MQQEQRAAALVVRRVMEGRTLPVALADVAQAGAPGNPAFVRELASGTLRHWGRLAALVQALARREPAPPLAALIAVALYQLDHTRAPPFAVVDRAVEAAATIAHAGVKSFVNALLRRYLREREALNAAVSAASPVARWSYPRWWIGRVQADHPACWESILSVGNERPPLTLRVNRRVVTRAALAAEFASRGIEVLPVGEAGLIVVDPQPVADLPGFADGAFYVQDAGAQLAASLLAATDGMRVLDACAAPGGKTTHLLELADVELVALDADAARLARVSDNLARLRLARRNVTLRIGDAGAPQAWWDARAFDRILADVPCTASGIVRRHPDGKWLRRKSDLATFAAQQQRILAALWTVLAPGGVLLYATCSVFAQENERVVNAFLEGHPGALRESINPGPLVAHDGGQLLPAGEGTSHNQDGFFYARLHKAA
ncbi:MAG: 16S rRNA (cytosine(967)-C(5))-methyltransferase RsmB [Burkholderiales bacterium]|nr:16S rRNA (cytosine(967)-C(5))-methyltransferase RsmB [Burkholderiales bacterium]